MGFPRAARPRGGGASENESRRAGATACLTLEKWGRPGEAAGRANQTAQRNNQTSQLRRSQRSIGGAGANPEIAQLAQRVGERLGGHCAEAGKGQNESDLGAVSEP